MVKLRTVLHTTFWSKKLHLSSEQSWSVESGMNRFIGAQYVVKRWHLARGSLLWWPTCRWKWKMMIRDYIHVCFCSRCRAVHWGVARLPVTCMDSQMAEQGVRVCFPVGRRSIEQLLADQLFAYHCVQGWAYTQVARSAVTVECAGPMEMRLHRRAYTHTAFAAALQRCSVLYRVIDSCTRYMYAQWENED